MEPAGKSGYLGFLQRNRPSHEVEGGDEKDRDDCGGVTAEGLHFFRYKTVCPPRFKFNVDPRRPSSHAISDEGLIRQNSMVLWRGSSGFAYYALRDFLSNPRPTRPRARVKAVLPPSGVLVTITECPSGPLLSVAAPGQKSLLVSTWFKL